ncbi:MAG TPA: hypothetical protein VK745_29265, partial [Polyangiaceae bacterium]|nr:hypothetical protein [Polyangiaceae bacterium]
GGVGGVGGAGGGGAGAGGGGTGAGGAGGGAGAGCDGCAGGVGAGAVCARAFVTPNARLDATHAVSKSDPLPKARMGRRLSRARSEHAIPGRLTRRAVQQKPVI